MKRVAVLAGDAFPPVRHPGAQRVLGWGKHLPAHEWETAIVTLPTDYRPPEHRDDELLEEAANLSVHRVAPVLGSRVPRSVAVTLDHRDGRGSWRDVVRRVIGAMLVPDARILWVPPAVRVLRRLVRDEGVEVVLTTSPEASSHVAGALARMFLGLPWVADLRDPWPSRWWEPGGLRRAVELWIARRTLRLADRVTAVSEGLAALAVSEYGVASERVSVIPHGFDPEIFRPGASRPRTAGPVDRRAFRIVHTGKVYASHSPGPFLDAAAKVANERPIAVRFLGDWSPDALREAHGYLDEDWLELVPFRPHAVALEEQREADLLVLFSGRSPHWVPSKTYEYLASGRPVLALCAEGTDVARLLEGFPQARRADPDDLDGIHRALEEALEGSPSPVPEAENSRRLAPLERGAVTARMAALLDDARGLP